MQVWVVNQFLRPPAGLLQEDEQAVQDVRGLLFSVRHGHALYGRRKSYLSQATALRLFPAAAQSAAALACSIRQNGDGFDASCALAPPPF